MYGNLLKALHYHVAKKAYPRYIPSSVKTMTKEPMFFDDFFLLIERSGSWELGKFPIRNVPLPLVESVHTMMINNGNGINVK